jgi:uncharacterized protein YjbJ (UPF0337 family)
MNKKEVTGTTQEIKGKAEQDIAKVTGNKDSKAHGKAEEVKGKTTKTVGQVEGKVEAVKKEVKGKIHRSTK